MRKSLFALVLVLLFALSLMSASAAPAKRSTVFFAPLSGAEEVPPVETNARGLALFHLNPHSGTLHYWLFVANIQDVTMAHIHLAPVGENGDVVVWLYPDSPPPQLIEGRFFGVLASGTIHEDDLVGPLEGASLSDLLDEIRAGNTYVNVHTLANPGGEIRGQIR